MLPDPVRITRTERRRIIDMLNIFMANIFENNSQLGPIVFWLAIIVVIGLIIATVVIHIRDKRKEKIDDQLDTQWRAEQVVNRVEAISPKSGKKKIRQIKRGSRDPKKIEEEQAAFKNTLLGGKSEAQREEKEAKDIFGSLGISSKKAEEIDKAKEQIIINGYLQKSNTLMNRISDSMQDTRKSRRTDAKNPIAAGFEIAWVDAHTSLMPRCPRRPEPMPPLLRMKATRQTTTIHMLDRHMHTRASR